MNEKKGKLSREILGIFGAVAAISIFFFGFLYFMSNSIALNYCEERNIMLTEIQTYVMNTWIRSLSLLAAVVLFVVIFLFLIGQKLDYLREIIRGINALRTERMNYEIPLEGNNELTELAESINYLAESERKLKEAEEELREERETFIRNISHDIRTPLTTILSYTELMEQNEDRKSEDIEAYVDLIHRKAQQIKTLTDTLLNNSIRHLEKIENGKLLMEQLAGEWEEMLEEEFQCVVDLERCPDFSGEFDIEELRRVFDNMASNVRKYADGEAPVNLSVFATNHCLRICQENRCRLDIDDVESNQIGLLSIRRILKNYGGDMEVSSSSEFFRITLQIPL